MKYNERLAYNKASFMITQANGLVLGHSRQLDSTAVVLSQRVKCKFGDIKAA